MAIRTAGVVILTSSPRSIPVVETLAAANLQICAVFCESQFVRDLATRLADMRVAPVLQWKGEAYFFKNLPSPPDFLLVAGFPHLLSKPLVGYAKKATINLHAGPLPRFRGGSPLQWQIISGRAKVGISAIIMNSKLDEGDVLLERTLALEAGDDIGSIMPRVNQEFASMSLECLLNFDNLFTRRRVQNPEDAHYWLQRQAEDGEIRPEAMDADFCINLIRAVTKPYPGAFIKIGEDRVIRIWRARMPDLPVMGTPGRIVFRNGAPHLVVCRDKAIQILDSETSHLSP